MAEFSGMNVEVIKGQVVPGFNRQAESVQQIIREVERLIQVVQNDWKGNDSKQFVNKWESEYRRPLNQLSEELKQLATTASKNAENQAQTSSTL